MDYHELELMLETPSVKWLRAQNAPLLLGFLHQVFKQEHRVAIAEGQLRTALESELEGRREAEPLAYPQTAADYLALWWRNCTVEELSNRLWRHQTQLSMYPRLLLAMAWPLLLLLFAGLTCAATGTAASASNFGWWPRQAVPNGFVRATTRSVPPAPPGAGEMLLQSVAGLAAKAVNDRRGDEMVWVATGNVDTEDWLARWRRQHPRMELRGSFDLWPLVERFTSRGIIKGYILYRADASKGELNEYRPDMNCSVNVATSLAGILSGVLVEETLETQAQQHGLKRLIDVRDKTQAWCWHTYSNQFHRAMVCTQDPRKPHVRDLAIAQQAFTIYGADAPMPSVMEWLHPLAPVLGWNGGDEFKATELSSRWGHIQTATDWCMNLPVLMAGATQSEPARARSFDPRTIDWKDNRSGVSFISTDGDNVQWFEGNFFRSGSKSYWDNPDRGNIPFGWSCCFSHLAQLIPDAIEYAVSSQSRLDEFIEWGGGYYYPDLFAIERTNRWELLAEQARRTWTLMQRNNTRLIGFNVAKFTAPDTVKACEIFARQTDGLLGILTFQYDAYEAGAGKTFWVKDRRGVEVPVVSARYSIWSQANRPRAGTPARIAREIWQSVEKTSRQELPRYDWVIAHVWSYFQKAVGTNELAEEPAQNGRAEGKVRGYSPVEWCAARLPVNIRVLGPEELFWRIRMNHDATETRKLIAAWR